MKVATIEKTPTVNMAKKVRMLIKRFFSSFLSFELTDIRLGEEVFSSSYLILGSAPMLGANPTR